MASPTLRVVSSQPNLQQLSRTTAESKRLAAAIRKHIKGKLTFCSDPLDVQWLRETHLKHIEDLPDFKSFEMEGNEDTPLRIWLYNDRFPSVFDVTLRCFVMNEDGVLV